MLAINHMLRCLNLACTLGRAAAPRSLGLSQKNTNDYKLRNYTTESSC